MAITAFLLLTCGKIQPVSPAHMDGRGNATRATFHSSYFMWDNISPTLNRISHDGKPDMKHKMSQKTLNITWHFRKCVIKQNWMKDDKSQRFRKSILRKMPALRVLQTTIQERITAKDISGGMKFQSKRRHSKHCRVQISWKPFYRMLIANETRFQGRCFTFSYLSDAYFKKNWWHFKKHNRKKT